MTHVYCAETARSHDEPLAGTASLVDLWLLLECPGPWASDALAETAHLGERVKRHLDAAMDSLDGLRVQLIQRGEPGPTRRAYVAVSHERDPVLYRVDFARYDELLSLDLAAFARRDPALDSLRSDRRVALVCTHGKHDPCCARYGAALYHSLADCADVEVWQSTHVGGDRFAANLVGLPDGLYFGRVDAATGPSVLADFARDRVDPALYRGRCVYGRFEQAAECFVRREAPAVGARDLTLRSCEGKGESRVVRFDDAAGGAHVATVRRVRDGRRALLTCGSTRAEPLVTFALDAYRRE